MSWFNLVYYPNPVKTQLVHYSVKEIAKRDVWNRHGYEPTEEIVKKELWIDPGGMLWMKTKPIQTSIDASLVEVKPEHIQYATACWAHHRVLDEQMSDGEMVVRVYLSKLFCVVLPQKLHQEIGNWLASLQTEGLVARAELSEVLSGIDNFISAPIDVKGEA